jgi:Flp pilus assembly pilin Flp
LGSRVELKALSGIRDDIRGRKGGTVKDMYWLSFAQSWLASKFGRDERGQGTVEYVLLILGVVLFLIVAAFALQGVLSGAISKISSWMGLQNPP